MHRTVPSLRNRFFSVIGSRTLGFGRRRYGRLILAIAGTLVFTRRHEICGSASVVKPVDNCPAVCTSPLHFLTTVYTPCSRRLVLAYNLHNARLRLHFPHSNNYRPYSLRIATSQSLASLFLSLRIYVGPMYTLFRAKGAPRLQVIGLDMIIIYQQ